MLLCLGANNRCKCVQGTWTTFCGPLTSSEAVEKYLKITPAIPYPHDIRCGCVICPDCSTSRSVLFLLSAILIINILQVPKKLWMELTDLQTLRYLPWHMCSMLRVCETRPCDTWRWIQDCFQWRTGRNNRDFQEAALKLYARWCKILGTGTFYRC